MTVTTTIEHDDGKAEVKLRYHDDTRDVTLERFSLIEGEDTVAFREYVMDTLDETFNRAFVNMGSDERAARQQWEGI